MENMKLYFNIIKRLFKLSSITERDLQKFVSLHDGNHAILLKAVLFFICKTRNHFEFLRRVIYNEFTY